MAAKPSTSAKTTHIAEYVAERTGLSVKEARVAVNATFEGIAKSLRKGDRVTMTGIGAFTKAVRPAQKGGQKATNPFTGQPYVTKPKPARTKVKFRAGKGFTQHLGGR